MRISAVWLKAYARQADADLTTFHLLQSQPNASECHRMLMLQMACEKLCKAYLIYNGSDPESLQSSHGYIAKPLPLVIANELASWRSLLKRRQGMLRFVYHLAVEIELLNPSVNRDDRRLDNCEYPWLSDNEAVHSPLDWTFLPTRLLRTPSGRDFLKLMDLSIKRLLKFDVQ